MDFNFTKTPKQSAFIQSPARYPALIGGYRALKTTSLAVKILASVPEAPDSATIIGHYRLNDLRRSTMREFFKVMGCSPLTAKTHPMVAGFDRSQNILTFKNNHEVYFMGLGSEAAISAFKGPTVSMVGLDQAELLSERMWDESDARVSDIKTAGYVAITANWRGHNWLWRKYLRDRFGDPNFPLWIVDTAEDNPFLPEGYIEALCKNHPKEWVDRYIHGSPDVTGGQVYDEWDERVHVIDPIDIPDEWKLGYGADFGLRNPTVFLGVAKDWDGNLIVYDEIYDDHKLPPYYARILKDPAEVQQGKHRIHSSATGLDLPIFGDPSFANINLTNGLNLQEEYFRHGVFIQKANITGKGGRSRFAGIMRVKELLTVKRDFPNPYNRGVMGASRVYVTRNCPRLIEEFPGYEWIDIPLADEEMEDPIEDVRKKNDHCMDALRYFIHSYMSLRAAPTPEAPKPTILESRMRKMFEKPKPARTWAAR